MVESTNPTPVTVQDEKERALANYKKKLNDYREIEQRLKDLRKKVTKIFRISFELKDLGTRNAETA